MCGSVNGERITSPRPHRHRGNPAFRGRRSSLDQNVFEVDAAEIAGIKVLQTWLDGELVWSYP